MIKPIFCLLFIGLVFAADPSDIEKYQEAISKARFFYGEWTVDLVTQDNPTEFCYPANNAKATFSSFDYQNMNMTFTEMHQSNCKDSKHMIVPFPVGASYLQAKEMEKREDDTIKYLFAVHYLKVTEVGQDSLKISFALTVRTIEDEEVVGIHFFKVTPIKTLSTDFPVPAIPKDYRKPESEFFLGDWHVVPPHKYYSHIGRHDADCCLPFKSVNFTRDTANSSQIKMTSPKWIGKECEGFNSLMTLNVPIPADSTNDFIPIKRKDYDLDAGTNTDSSLRFGVFDYNGHHVWTDNSRQESFRFMLKKSHYCSVTLMRNIKADNFSDTNPVFQEPTISHSVPLNGEFGVQFYFGDDKMINDQYQNILLGLSSSHNVISTKSYVLFSKEKIFRYEKGQDKYIILGDSISKETSLVSYPGFSVEGKKVNAQCTMQKGLWKTNLQQEEDKFTIIDKYSFYGDYESQTLWKVGMIGMGIEGKAKNRFDKSVKSFGIKLDKTQYYKGELIFNPNTANSGMNLHGTFNSDSNWKISGLTSVSLGKTAVKASVSDMKIVFDVNEYRIILPSSLKQAVFDSLEINGISCLFSRCDYDPKLKALPALSLHLENDAILNILPEQYIETPFSGYTPGKKYDNIYFRTYYGQEAKELKNTIVLGRDFMSTGLSVFNFTEDQPKIQFYSSLPIYTPPPVEDDKEPEGTKKPEEPSTSIFSEWWFYIIIVVIVIVIVAGIYFFIAKYKKSKLQRQLLNESNDYANIVNAQA